MQATKKILLIVFCILLGQDPTQGAELPHLPSNCPSYKYIWQNWRNLEVGGSLVWGGKNFEVLKIVGNSQCLSNSITVKALNYPLSPRYYNDFVDICAYGFKCAGSLIQTIVVGVPRNDG